MVAEAEIHQAQVRRILQSKAFRTSEVHRNLLNYLAEKSLSGEAGALKEYTVGLEVFQKPESYDPRQESVVRMHMARLRQKLAEYYRTEGVDDPVIVDLPKGAFRVTFEPRAVAVAPVPEPEPVDPEIVSPALARTPKRTIFLLTALAVAAIACASYFGVRLEQVERGATATAAPTVWTPELRELWTPLITADRPLVVVLATQQAGNLTGLSTANGAFLLGQFLADRKQNVYVTGSDEISMPDIMMGNLVLLGPARSSRQLQALPAKEELVEDPSGIRNLHPASGEPAFFPNPPMRTAQSTVDESYALITHSPGVNGKGDVLSLSGNHPSSVSAGVEALTDPTVARTIVMRIRKADGKLPRYYQILLKVRSMDETPIEITYVFHKEIAATAISGSLP
jgi:hypothetical protein